MAFVVTASSALAERVLRIEEVPIGELDPHKAIDYIDSIINFNVYDSLVWPNPDGTFSGLLAESWEVSDDGLNYTFTMRDVKFHDGSMVDAHDVVYSLARTQAIGQAYGYLFTDLTATAVDDRTARITLPASNAAFLATLPRLSIVNSGLARANQQDGDFGENGDYSSAFLSGNDAGSGAYTVESHNMQELTILKAYADYFEAFDPLAPETVQVRYGISAATMRTLMANGELDLSNQWHPYETYGGLSDLENVALTTEKGVGYVVLPIHTQKPPTDDVHFLRAMVYALNYDAFANIVKVTDDLYAGIPARTAIPRAMFGYDTDAPAFKQDLDRARAELAKSKYADSLDDYEVELAWVAEVPIEEKTMLQLQYDLGQIGIKSRITKNPWVRFSDRATTTETTPHVGLLNFSATYSDPISLLGDYHSSARGSYLSMWWLDDPEVDRLIEASRVELDISKRAEVLKQLQRRILDVAPAIYAYEFDAVFAKGAHIGAPPLDDDSKTVPVMGGNFRFRTWQVGDAM
jgi:peptide/nickel transport system substrate-binding protein